MIASGGIGTIDDIATLAELVPLGVEGAIAGDVAADVYDVARYVSPNPGGVGPMTRAMLLSNVVDRAEALHG